MKINTSPCIKICRIQDNVCKGCYRTLDEIAKWTSYSDTEKDNVLKNCTRRQKKDDEL